MQLLLRLKLVQLQLPAPLLLVLLMVHLLLLRLLLVHLLLMMVPDLPRYGLKYLLQEIAQAALMLRLQRPLLRQQDPACQGRSLKKLRGIGVFAWLAAVGRQE